MTLADQLQGMSGTIKLGSDSGSGFFFIGDAKLLLDKISEFDMLLNHAIRTTFKVVDIKTWYLNKYVSLMEKKVVEVYTPHVYDEDTTIIIIEGDTQGKYWTVDEVDPYKPMAFRAAGRPPYESWSA